jgi:hypothetical protein
MSLFLVTVVAGVGPEAGCFVRIHAQAALDATGHWDGNVMTPNGSVAVAFDIARDDQGALMATFDQPGQGLHGLLVQTVLLEGHTLTLVVRDDQPFSGTLSDDGKTVNGAISVEGYDIPVTLERTGDARIDQPAQSVAVDARFVGTWLASTAMGPISLVIANRNGGASAMLVNDSEGGLRIPAHAITATGAHIALDLKAISGTFDGDLNADGTEIAGSYTQGAQQAPITFRKST